jgi:hypothetical protein
MSKEELVEHLLTLTIEELKTKRGNGELTCLTPKEYRAIYNRLYNRIHRHKYESYQPVKRKAYYQSVKSTDKYKERVKKYAQMDSGKAVLKKAQKKYEQTEKGKLAYDRAKKKYAQSDRCKEKQKERKLKQKQIKEQAKLANLELGVFVVDGRIE